VDRGGKNYEYISSNRRRKVGYKAIFKRAL